MWGLQVRPNERVELSAEAEAQLRNLVAPAPCGIPSDSEGRGAEMEQRHRVCDGAHA